MKGWFCETGRTARRRGARRVHFCPAKAVGHEHRQDKSAGHGSSPTGQVVPVSIVESLAQAILGLHVNEWPTGRSGLVEAIAHPQHRSLVVGFFDACRVTDGDMPRHVVATALLTASITEQAYREYQSVELVWTGPDVGVVPLRRTEQVMLQVIDSAIHRLTVVSYAGYNIPRICEALLRAAARGVTIKVIGRDP